MQTLIKAIIAILLTVSLSWAESTVVVVGQPTTSVCTTPADGDIFNEGFIGTGGANSGYENAGWTETVGTNGTVDQDYTLTGTGWSAGACTEGLRTRQTSGGSTTYAVRTFGTPLSLSTSVDIYAEFNIASHNLALYSNTYGIYIRDSDTDGVARFELTRDDPPNQFAYNVAGSFYPITTGAAHTVKIHIDATAANSYIQVDGGTQRSFTRTGINVAEVRLGTHNAAEIDIEWGRVWIDRP